MDTAKRKYQSLVTDSRNVPGIFEDIEKVPAWFDKERFERGQQFCQRYFFSFMSSQLCGLLMILQLSAGLIPLLCTGNSKNAPKLFRRYVSTYNHVKTWLESNPFDKNSQAYKSFKAVRRMHENIYKFMNETWKSCDRDDMIPQRLWISQHDMVLTVWAFIGPVILYPKHCGLHNYTVEELEDVIYMWRVFSYAHGIKDEYNICTGNLEETRELFTIIWENSFRKVIMMDSEKSKIGIEMGKAIGLTLREAKFRFNWAVYMKYWLKILKIPREIEIDIIETIRFYLYGFVIEHILKIDFVHRILSAQIRREYKNFTKNKAKYEKILQEKYPHIEFAQVCLFSYKFDYTDFDEIKNETSNDNVCGYVN